MKGRRPVNSWSGESNLPEYVKSNQLSNGSFDWLNKDNWQPALERLVESIGKKFSSAFDRKLVAQVILCILQDEQGLVVLGRSRSARMTITTSGPLTFS